MIEEAALAVGALEAAVGLVTLLRASEMRPNTYLGFRVPQAFLTERIWRRVNRAAGLAGLANSLAVCAAALLVGGIWALLYAVLSAIGIVAGVCVYARLTAERETGREPGGDRPLRRLPEVGVDPRPLALGVMIVAVSALSAISLRGSLPAELAVHFDLEGRPNFFMPRDEFLAAFFLLLAGYEAAICSVAWSVRGMPSLEGFEEYNEGLARVLEAFSLLIPAVTCWALASILAYNLTGAHPLPVAIEAAVLAALAGTALLMIFRRGG